MEFLKYLWLFLSALAAGVVNAIAGGGTLLTYPALTAVVSFNVANATSTVALSPGSCASTWGYRRQMQGCGRWLRWLTPPSVLGGGVGASLVEPDSFHLIVPWLILSAAVLFLLQPTLTRLLRRQAAALHEPSLKILLGITVVQFFISVYGGYFGAGIGILMLSSLSFLGLKDIHQINAVKTFLAFCINIIASLIFIAKDLVCWKYALVMAVAAIVGGYLGARFSLRLKPALVRGMVICIGFVLAAYYFAKEFGGVTM